MAIQRIQEAQRGHFDSLDELLADMTEAIPLPITNFLRLHFRLKHNHIDLLTYLGFNTLDSFLVYNALSVGDFVATIGSSYINHPDLAMILLVVRVCGAVFHNHAQELQHNVLAVGQTSYKVDLSKLPRKEMEMYTFLNAIAGHKIRAVVTLLNWK